MVVSAKSTVTIGQLLERCRTYLPEDRVELIERAYEFAERAHSGQLRVSGEPYINHPIGAAMTVAELQLDASSIAAALLHDVVEDCGVVIDEVQANFGDEVAKLVEGVTKLSRMQWVAPEGRIGDEEIQAENLRKMFLAMAEDNRVVLVKLADRLHNMRTLDALPPEKRLRIARETMDVYAPLASRLGIWQMKWELEDLSFRHLDSKQYKEISQLVAARRTERERHVQQVETTLRDELEAHGIHAEVRGRAKHIYSIYKKMQRYTRQGKTFDQIYDLLALRVIVDEVSQCYQALGVVHNLWKPMPGQFDDYIAQPKESMYQSLH
ncbi:MAG TPA: HD domain-containing protein, partial [Dehalococcoidia bacterium]|nr:HD domain-containing protein [Dehalococcoidia bacterium]